MNRYLKTVFNYLGIGVAFAALTDILLTLICSIRQINPLLYKVSDAGVYPGRLFFICAGAAAGLIYVLFSGGKRSGEILSMWTKNLAPLWLLFFIPVTSFPGIFFAVAVIALTVFQVAGMWKKQLPELPGKYGSLIAISGGAIIALWGYFLQVHAFDTLHFVWGDWNQYAEHYQHLLSGNARFVQWCAGAGHWNLGVNLVMTALLKLWYAPHTIFMVNALCIASIVPLGYSLSTKCNLSRWMSVVLLILTVFNPVLSNQYLSLFYGFHPIVFFVPLLFGFFIAREYKCRWGMVILFILSLLVQETVCVFWAGYAIYLLCSKRWKSGITLFLLMVGLFLFFVKAVIPESHSTENYSQMFHYASLGNNMFEVAMSPFMHPAVFLKTVFERSSLCFVLAVFVPFLFGIVFKPLRLVALLPLLAGVILQGSPDVKSVMLQYGVECTAFLIIVMILNLKDIYPELRRPALCAVVFSTVLCGYLLGMIPGGKGPLKNLMARADGREMVVFLTKAVEQVRAERILATGKLRCQLQFYYPVRGCTEPFRHGDVILLDLHDTGMGGTAQIKDLRERIMKDKRVIPVTYCVWENHTIVMFKVMGHPGNWPPLPFLGVVKETDFAKFGNAFPIPDKSISLRGIYHNGRNIYRVRINKRVKDDFDIMLKLESAGMTKEVIVRFANGLLPASAVGEGTVFEFSVPGNLPEKQFADIVFIK